IKDFNKVQFINLEYKKNIELKFRVSLAILIFFLVLMLFAFGGIQVLLGNIDKGEFRLNIGGLGFLAFLITKLFAPGILVYLTILYKKNRNVIGTLKKTYIICLITVICIGASWGFKSTAIVLLIPSAIIYYDIISLKKLFVLSFSAIILLVFFAFLFDQREVKLIDFNNLTIENSNQVKNFSALEFIIYRLTISQGNAAWRVWDLHMSGVEMPNYWLTLTSVFGDKILSIAGITHSNTNEFINSHYSYLVTDLVTGMNKGLTFEHNVTSTTFSEGVLFGGFFGVCLFGGFIGYLTAIIRNKIIYYYYT
ncbi:hypothetical protein, partial [Algoriphagus sp. A40]|uniref:hypothetical protein n=1 Tax=Algoriphagus sp. A40 TaxID=1945863 RepID=UPI0009CD7AFF